MTAVKALCTGQREKKMGVSGESELVVMKLVILYNRVCKLSFNIYSVGEVLRKQEWPEGVWPGEKCTDLGAVPKVVYVLWC